MLYRYSPTPRRKPFQRKRKAASVPFRVLAAQIMLLACSILLLPLYHTPVWLSIPLFYCQNSGGIVALVASFSRYRIA